MRLQASILLLLCASCAVESTGSRTMVDFMFRETGASEPGVLALASPALVNELNGAFTVSNVGFYPRSSLAADGVVARGDNRVFVLDFVDHGDISILRTDDKRLCLRAEMGPDGRVIHALLGAPGGAVSDGFTAFENDRFESGTWQLLYDGPDVVVGRLDLKFRKYAVNGNFRAPRLR